jgi:hypothetical protein
MSRLWGKQVIALKGGGAERDTLRVGRKQMTEV